MNKSLVILFVIGLILSCFQDLYAEPAEFLVNSFTENDQKSPTVAMSKSGNFVIIWESNKQDVSNWGIYAQRYDPHGRKLGGEIRVNSDRNEWQWDWEPSVAMDNEGNFVIIWSRRMLYWYDIYGQRFDKNGIKIGGEFQVNTYTDLDQWEHSIAMDDEGNFVVVWTSEEQDESEYSVYAQRFDNDSNRIGCEFKVNTFSESKQHQPSVALGSDGDFIIVWRSVYKDINKEYNSEIVFQRFDHNGDKVGGEVKVISIQSGKCEKPLISMDTKGQYLITWILDYDLIAQKFGKDDQTLGEEILINTNCQVFFGIYTIAINSSGNFVSAWFGSSDYDYYGISAQKIDSDGNAIGDKFQVNTYLEHMQINPTIAMDDEGNFLIAWECENPKNDQDRPDGSGYGIYAKLYKDNQLPTDTPTISPTPTISTTPTLSQTSTLTPSLTISATNTNTITYTPTIKPTLTITPEPKPIQFRLHAEPDKNIFTKGESLTLLFDVETGNREIDADIYFVMLDPDYNIYFGMHWFTNLIPLLENFRVPAGLSISGANLLELYLPSSEPFIVQSGTFIFVIAATQPRTLKFISNVAIMSFYFG